MSCTCWVAVAALAVALGAILPNVMTVIPLSAVSPPSARLLDPTYDIEDVVAPAATGRTLQLLSLVISSPVLGPPIARLLLNQNGVHHIRELSQQVPPSVVHHPHPVVRLNADAHAEHARLAAASSDVLSAQRVGREARRARRADRAGWRLYDYRDAYLSGATTPSEVLHELIDVALPLAQNGFGAVFTEVHRDEVMEAARASSARWRAKAPLSIFDGVPVGIKEMIDVRGHLTGQGSWRGGRGGERLPSWRSGGLRGGGEAASLPDPAAPRDAAADDDPIVAKLRAAGAIIVGVTAMTEWGVTPLGWSAHAQGPRNPHNLSHYPGGSSSGSAVAVALGLVPVAVGFDGGGSIRIPAALSGVHGLAATFGRIDHRASPENSMIHAGPLAGSATDAALAYLLLASPQPGEAAAPAYGGDGPPAAHLSGVIGGGCAKLDGVRLGLFAPWADDASPEVASAFHSALARLSRSGAQVVPISIPNMRSLALSHGLAISAEFAWAVDRELTSGWPLEPSTAIQLVLGRAVTAAEVVAANRLRSWALEHVKSLFKEHRLDAIVTPTVSRTAPPMSAGAIADGESNTALVMALIKHIFLANLLGLPAVSAPIGLGASTRLPVGMQLIGEWWGEAKILRIACALDELEAEAREGAEAEGEADADAAPRIARDVRAILSSLQAQ